MKIQPQRRLSINTTSWSSMNDVGPKGRHFRLPKQLHAQDLRRSQRLARLMQRFDDSAVVGGVFG